MKKRITIPEFALALGVSRKTVERLIKDGKIEAVKKNPLAGRTSPFLIPVEELTRLKRMQDGQAQR